MFCSPKCSILLCRPRPLASDFFLPDFLLPVLASLRKEVRSSCTRLFLSFTHRRSNSGAHLSPPNWMGTFDISL